MHALCVLVAGALRATLPADEFTLAWQHSVQKTPWRETYRVTADRLVPVEARVQGSGAGMEPGPDARLVDGWWVWRPAVAPLASLTVARSPFAPDYQLCIADSCAPLGDYSHGTTDPETVELRPCVSALRK